MVERVDESLKADIMHWAAIYVCGTDSSHPCLTYWANIGGSNAARKQENLPSGGVGDQSNEFIQGTCCVLIRGKER